MDSKTDDRCPHCRIAVWSHYGGSEELTSFVRVGTLDDPEALPPDVHIFTSSKQAWVEIPTQMPAYAEFYELEDVWSQGSLERWKAIRAQLDST